jgi:hypothetical protein
MGDVLLTSQSNRVQVGLNRNSHASPTAQIRDTVSQQQNHTSFGYISSN